jgi:hypothetical protein
LEGSVRVSGEADHIAIYIQLGLQSTTRNWTKEISSSVSGKYLIIYMDNNIVDINAISILLVRFIVCQDMMIWKPGKLQSSKIEDLFRG